MVDVKEAGRDVFSLPVTANSVVPPITLLTPFLDYGRCFIRHLYVRDVELVNESNLPVRYQMTSEADERFVVCSTAHPSGIIEAHTSLSVPLEIRAQLQGEIVAKVAFAVLGNTDFSLDVGVYCIGEGPVVSFTPSELNWGVCPVLTPLTKTVTLRNETLIPAEIECILVSYSIKRMYINAYACVTTLPRDKIMQLHSYHNGFDAVILFRHVKRASFL